MSQSTVGSFVWYELMTSDTKAAISFYSEVIGWKAQAWEGDYTMWVGAQGPLGGTMTLAEQAKKMGAPPHWLGSIEVADADKTAARVTELGGKVYHGPIDIPKIGRYAVIADPQGATSSIIQMPEPMPPHDREKHGEFCWAELYTTDKDAGLAFYKDLFGWEKILDHDMGPMGVYTIYGAHGKQYGGIMNKPKEMQMPSAFMYYVEVLGLDAALARAKNNGAKVLNGPMSVPGGARIVQLLDPQGAAFSLHEKA